MEAPSRPDFRLSPKGETGEQDERAPPARVSSSCSLTAEAAVFEAREEGQEDTICYAHSMRIDWRSRIEIQEDLHHGDPCIRGTRVPVRTIIGSLADGMSADEIRDAYPQLGLEDISAALAYAAEVLKDDVVIPLSA